MKGSFFCLASYFAGPPLKNQTSQRKAIRPINQRSSCIAFLGDGILFLVYGAVVRASGSNDASNYNTRTAFFLAFLSLSSVNIVNVLKLSAFAQDISVVAG